MLAAELVALPLADRLLAMEALWDSLCREPDAKYPTPDWHADVLHARITALDTGKETAVPWDEAKARIRAKAQVLARQPQ
ncbi:MAG: hypothetical protein A3F78_05260 [Burkholderiales bacterium RIFCSPLOWO2_12_FULL_61_40]|nr:MAG: hypothetical protein A3F78_05260 [Burkholderiales bacterium RIFCSPLOWO2_12_FULL_61_40]